VGGGLLVQPDQLVDLVAGKPAAAPDQGVEPPPLRFVRCHVGVDIHPRRLLAADR
jgi:hypothetical protein